MNEDNPRLITFAEAQERYGNGRYIDLGIIQVKDVVAAGQLELLPFTSGRVIRAVYFRPDGFVSTADVGFSTLMFVTSPNTALLAASHYGKWDASQDVLRDTFGNSIFADDIISFTYDGSGGFWVKGSVDNIFRDNGPLIFAHDFAWINTTTDKPRVWAANTEFAQYEYVIVGGFVQVATTQGRTGSFEPTWDTDINDTTDDGSVQWTNKMAADIAGAIHVVVEVEHVDAPDYPRPTSFEFLQQPTDVVADAVITPAITVRVLDQNGDPYLFQARTIVLCLAGAGTLGGGVEQNIDLTTGITTFNDLTVHEPGTYTLVARFQSWGVPYIRLVSDPFDVTAP